MSVQELLVYVTKRSILNSTHKNYKVCSSIDIIKCLVEIVIDYTFTASVAIATSCTRSYCVVIQVNVFNIKSSCLIVKSQSICNLSCLMRIKNFNVSRIENDCIARFTYLDSVIIAIADLVHCLNVLKPVVHGFSDELFSYIFSMKTHTLNIIETVPVEEVLYHSEGIFISNAV